MFAIQVVQAQIDEFRDTDASIVEQPKNGAVAHRCSFSKRTRLMGWSTGKQELFKLLAGNRLDKRLADFGKDHALKGIALESATTDQPVEEGTRRARIGLNGAFAAYFAMGCRSAAQVRKPGADIISL